MKKPKRVSNHSVQLKQLDGKVKKAIGQVQSQTSASNVVAALQNNSSLVLSCLQRRVPVRGSDGKWRCSVCRRKLTSHAHIAWHACPLYKQPCWSKEDMKKDKLIETGGMGDELCSVCKRVAGDSHRCPCTALRFTLVDFSASSVAPVASGKHNSEGALRKLRDYGAHAGKHLNVHCRPATCCLL
jgi:hypothetical protein